MIYATSEQRIKVYQLSYLKFPPAVATNMTEAALYTQLLLLRVFFYSKVLPLTHPAIRPFTYHQAFRQGNMAEVPCPRTQQHRLGWREVGATNLFRSPEYRRPKNF